MNRIEAWRERADRLQFSLDATELAVEKEHKELIKSRKREALAEEARDLLQQVGQAVQQQAHDQVAHVVARCLEAVFGEQAYGFKIEFERKRGRTEARMAFLWEGQEIDPMSAGGGGCVDVASFALRVACLMLTKPALRKVLILDEPFRHLSREYRPCMAELVMVLARELGIQFILVTHDREFQVGKIIEIG